MKFREFKFEVQQVAGRNNGSKTLPVIWAAYSSPSLWEGERGEGFERRQALSPSPLPTGEGDKLLVQIAGPISSCTFKLESTFD